MNEDVVALALKRVGSEVHFHDGVWWQSNVPMVCKPLNPLRAIVKGAARPNRLRSLLGYSHVVPAGHPANSSWSLVYQDRSSITQFGMERLKPKRRSCVRNGLRQINVRRIEDIEGVLEWMNEISISTAMRTGHGLPPDYYRTHKAEWEAAKRQEFSIPGRNFWGGFRDGRLVAYLYAVAIGDTLEISAFKSHTDYLRFYPNEALLYSFLEFCRDLRGYEHLIYGEWSDDTPTLNKFKEQFGFSKKIFPLFRRESLPFRKLKGWRSLLHLFTKYETGSRNKAVDAHGMAGFQNRQTERAIDSQVGGHDKKADGTPTCL